MQITQNKTKERYKRSLKLALWICFQLIARNHSQVEFKPHTHEF